MRLNRSHKKFSEAGELLCLLPQFPRNAPFRFILDDLALNSRADIYRLISSLERRGFKVTVGIDPHHGLAAMLDRETGKRATTAAEAYWDRVYDDSILPDGRAADPSTAAAAVSS